MEHEQRIIQQSREYFAYALDDDGGIGSFGPPEVFLLGDSHAGSLRSGVDTLLRERGIAGYAVSRSSTDMFDLRFPDAQTALRKISEFPRVSHVILTQMWQCSWYPEEPRKPTASRYAQLEEFSVHLKSMGKTLLITADIPQYHYPPADIAARIKIITPRHMNIAFDSQEQSDVEYDREQCEINSRLEDICKKTGAVFIPLHLAFKQGNHYVSSEIKGGETMPLYRDTDHLSMAGSIRAARFIVPYLVPRASPPGRQRLAIPQDGGSYVSNNCHESMGYPSCFADYCGEGRCVSQGIAWASGIWKREFRRRVEGMSRTSLSPSE